VHHLLVASVAAVFSDENIPGRRAAIIGPASTR
jgi:hypothetical protein